MKEKLHDEMYVRMKGLYSMQGRGYIQGTLAGAKDRYLYIM